MKYRAFRPRNLGSADLERWILSQCLRTERGCLVWQGPIGRGGYGKLKVGGRSVTLHRWIFENHYGSLGAKDFVCHRCDIPRCVSIEHLFRGDQTTNMLDMVQKGRQAYGERHPQAVLSEKDVTGILLSAHPPRVLAKQFDVSVRTIYKIKYGQRWKHLRASIDGRPTP